ncbi:SagB/ThcOx family dehydrogenase [Candidatus Methylomicrobium oryzae]|jgi:SagB-type dehydrogenase family enzyme|uniref:SagB/ThcOx family dehydrogenase n=1 Tax=Candidatus Methylomicrobium oryzae TaxID=2802053 RepID=UPI001922141E|nr:SagB/ThcOx family dehydrogenase [Methylomicrobium sp. RS1]MBL1262759.1 SagB/ThcOx family dehydrogenase [Methylomicrobium sp. RS1]
MPDENCSSLTASKAVFHYHQRTKHRLDAYAKGPTSLDWEDQPDPFRRFEGCDTVPLPLPGREVECLFGDLDRPEKIVPQTLNLDSLGLFLELALGLSAWKQYGPDRWALRCNPSSGNLHPTEAYLIFTGTSALPAGVYHYLSHDHLLERRCHFEPIKSEPALYIGLSSIHWREAWKYGERAFRYCQHDAGHALAALSYAAACLGWRIELLGETADADLAGWLGLDRAEDFIEHEREAPDLFCRVHASTSPDRFAPTELSECLRHARWFGKAERLSRYHFYRWPVIDDVAHAAQKPATPAERWQAPVRPLPPVSYNLPTGRLIRQRRSAQHFDSRSAALALPDFQRIIQAVLPNAKPPFTAWNWAPQVHFLLFVHRVESLEPGLYFLPRGTGDVDAFRQAFSKEYAWETVAAPFALYRLFAGNVRQAAKTLSCHQSIASDSAFSLGMLAQFADNIDAEPWRYRRLFWECGLLGQILYLEAEAAGVRGTGIGCFFDDAVHGVLGLTDDRWQSLYHFTVGEALEDARLQSLPPYGHLQ